MTNETVGIIIKIVVRPPCGLHPATAQLVQPADKKARKGIKHNLHIMYKYLNEFPNPRSL